NLFKKKGWHEMRKGVAMKGVIKRDLVPHVYLPAMLSKHYSYHYHIPSSLLTFRFSIRTCPNKIKTRTEHKIGSLKFREGDAG
ncbi:MAG TPA: hypothetical protein P5023_08560, partial [Bacteroidales bacterium]|nr:hypothetical protein [Bacteroidales bacterium]